jgi:hypothetical protein
MSDVFLNIKKRIGRVKLQLEQEHYIHFHTPVRNTVLLSSMGRSGSTWIASLMNHAATRREIFEPFLPVRVPEANAFEYTAYVAPANADAALVRAATNILEGRLARQAWLDRDNKHIVSWKRLIKDIRTNLMLGWFRAQFPGMKVVLLIRNPFSVVQSFLELGWGIEPCGQRREIDILLSQSALLQDYPEIATIAKEVDLADKFESLMLQWCILNYVPLQQKKHHDFHITHYENYLQDPASELRKLYAYMEEPLHETVFTSLKKPSRTSYDKKNFSVQNNYFSPEVMRRGTQILKAFGLHEMYDSQGYPIAAQ